MSQYEVEWRDKVFGLLGLPPAAVDLESPMLREVQAKPKTYEEKTSTVISAELSTKG